MNFKHIILFLFIFIAGKLFSYGFIDSLLLSIDHSIENNEVYTSEKELRIDRLKKQLEYIPENSIEEFNLNQLLYTEYKPYVCDSAIYYLNRNIEIAQSMNDIEREIETKLQLAYLMGSSAMYKEAVDMMETIERKSVPGRLMIYYYQAYDHIYGELSYYTQDPGSAGRYHRIAEKYKDSLNVILPYDDDLRLVMQETVLRDIGNCDEARKINDIRLSKVEFGTPDYALITFHRALSYRHEGNTEKVKFYLALSALSDIQSAIKDHASLWMLAEILYEEGDIERAYNYIRFSWNETVFYNARLRSLQSAGILSLIDKTYQAMIEKQNSTLRNYLILISFLVLFLASTLFYIYKQMQRLAVARKNQQSANNQLKKLNGELKQLNTQLQSTNIELNESNHIKEEYIGRFIKLCSTYIDKLDSFRRLVNKKITNGEVAELVRMTRSQDIFDKEFAELYANFDTAFLQIFPDFVPKVNELLHYNEQIVLKKGELLNTELRILALIRLGINDSSQIADFLRYSVNTIYNYRAKIKNKAISREEFENLILMIR